MYASGLSESILYLKLEAELAVSLLHSLKTRVVNIELLITRDFHLELKPEVKLF